MGELFHAVHLSTVHTIDSPRIVYKELAYLAESGWDTAYVCSDPSENPQDSIPVHRVARSRSRAMRFLVDGYRAWRAAVRLRPDVIHFHDPELLFWIPWFARRTRADLVFDVHEYYLESILDKHWIPRVLQGPLRLFVKWVERTAVRRLSGFVVVSDHMARLYRRYGKPIAVIPNYPKRILFSDLTRDPELARRYEGRRVIVYVGSLSARRGLDTVLDAFAKVRARVSNAFLLLIGGFESAEYESRFRKKARDLLPFDSYEIAGKVPHSEVFKYLKAADLGVYLPGSATKRYQWGEPTKLFEYCAAGLPAVVSDMEAKRRVLSAAGNGILVSPENPGQIADAMARILLEPDLARKFSENGRAAFERLFCWEAIAPRLTELYEAMRRAD